MYIENWTRKISKGIYLTTDVGAWIGSIAVVGMILLVFVGAFSRYVLRNPVPGTFELTEQTMGVLGGFAIMCAAVKRAHVALDLIVSRFPKRTQMIMERAFLLLGFGTWAVVAYQVCVRLVRALESSEMIQSRLPISAAPALLMLVLGLFMCSLTLLVQAFGPAASGEAKELRE